MKLFAKKLEPSFVQKVLQEKICWLTAFSNPLQVILFGSAANDEMTDASDVDLIVIYNNSSDLKSIQKNLFRNRPKNDWPQDIFFYTEESFQRSCKKGGGIAWLAQREGRAIYTRNNINDDTHNDTNNDRTDDINVVTNSDATKEKSRESEKTREIIS